MPTTDGGAILVAGATSGAGKSTITAALCRLLSRADGSVAPFKAQNMSNHAAVTADGGEVGRAQAMQAAAARIDVERRMNPVLLKPGSDTTSHLVVMGDEISDEDAVGYGRSAQTLKPVVLDALSSLRSDYDWVVLEGAGGAAEPNLWDRDLVNLPLAASAGVPAVLVVDIEPGGAFAAAHGTIDLLPPRLRSTVRGVIINRFRGDPTLLRPAIEILEQRAGVPVLGVLPHLGPEPLLGVEDSLDIPFGAAASTHTADPLRVAAVRLPRLANPSDLDPLLIEPSVSLRWVTTAAEIDGADLIVVPGSRATVTDLAWLRERGLADAIVASVRRDRADVIGICAGFQMLGQTIDDPVESTSGATTGLGLLDTATVFRPRKTVRRSSGTFDGIEVAGYQIRFGQPSSSTRPWLDVDGQPEGAVDAGGLVRGTSLHGVFDADEFRSVVLAEIATRRGRAFQPSTSGYADNIDRQHDRLADWLSGHLDTDRLLRIAREAGPADVPPGW